MPILEGKAILTFLWDHKWELLALVVIVCIVLYVLALKGEIALKSAEITTQKATMVKKDGQIKELARNNEILQNNMAAIADQEKQLKEIKKSSAELRRLLKDIPREGLKDEKITRFNDCLVEYGNTGRVSESCSMSLKARLPDARPATTN